MEKSTSFVSFRPRAMRGMLAVSLYTTHKKISINIVSHFAPHLEMLTMLTTHDTARTTYKKATVLQTIVNVSQAKQQCKIILTIRLLRHRLGSKVWSEIIIQQETPFDHRPSLFSHDNTVRLVYNNVYSAGNRLITPEMASLLEKVLVLV